MMSYSTPPGTRVGRIGPKAVPHTDEVPRRRQHVELRSRRGGAGRRLAPMQRKRFRITAPISSAETNFRRFARPQLRHSAAIGPKAEDAIPALVKMVLNPQPIRFEEETILPLRMEAAKALVAIGPKARPAIQKEVIPAIEKAAEERRRRWHTVR